MHMHEVHGAGAMPYDCGRCAARFFFRAELQHHGVEHERRCADGADDDRDEREQQQPQQEEDSAEEDGNGELQEDDEKVEVDEMESTVAIVEKSISQNGNKDDHDDRDDDDNDAEMEEANAAANNDEDNATDSKQAPTEPNDDSADQTASATDDIDEEYIEVEKLGEMTSKTPAMDDRMSTSSLEEKNE